MDITNLVLRALDDNGEVYEPYYFDNSGGVWTEGEKKLVKEIMDKHCPSKVDAGYNNWCFSRVSYGFNAKRATWKSLIFASTIEEFCDKLQKCHERN